MSAAELTEAVLVARGSMQDEPQRTTLARAVVRACVEVERTMTEPRLLVRRDHGQVFVALSQELASYASRLGNEADKLADEDPLVPPARWHPGTVAAYPWRPTSNNGWQGGTYHQSRPAGADSGELDRKRASGQRGQRRRVISGRTPHAKARRRKDARE